MRQSENESSLSSCSSSSELPYHTVHILSLEFRGIPYHVASRIGLYRGLGPHRRLS